MPIQTIDELFLYSYIQQWAWATASALLTLKCATW